MKEFYNKQIKNIKNISYALGVVWIVAILIVPIYGLEVWSSGVVNVKETIYCSIGELLLNGFNVVKVTEYATYNYSGVPFSIIITIASAILGVVFINKKKTFALGICLIIVSLFGTLFCCTGNVIVSEAVNIQGYQGTVGTNFYSVLVTAPVMTLVMNIGYKKSKLVD